MKRDIYCTEDNPDRDAQYHPDAYEVDQEDGWPGGDIVIYECPWCGRKLAEELPQ